jgi:ubiquinone/menaquinone biosynthesis C-methylase UbiE
MASDFEQVIGVDVADGMVDTARQHLTAANIDFRIGDGMTLPAEGATVDGVFSTHVFQHFDSLDVARANFEEIARVLRPGGSLMIHLPAYLPPTGVPLIDRAVRARAALGDLRAARYQRRGTPLMRNLRYSWQWLETTLQSIGFVAIELAVFSVISNGTSHPFVLARLSDPR